MLLSLNWIREFVDVPAKFTAKQLAELLTLRTCEVEGYEDQKLKFANMVVGRVISMRPHLNANKLRLVDTDIGRTVQIVCGGQNLREGMLVAVALPGALVRWHGEEKLTELKEVKIRGETSFGMICAGEEIGLLPDNTKASKEIRIHDLSNVEVMPGTALAEGLGLTDTIFEIDNKSLTHRPDLWSHYGMAREFSAFLGKKLAPCMPKVAFPKKGAAIKVTVEKSDILTRFLTVIITGVKVEPSPEWMQQRLQVVGVRPVNNIVDITNYVMLELGYPMHAFDRRTVKSDSFLIRYARRAETLETLDHKKRTMTEEDAVITNGTRTLGIAGIMGGLNSEITDSTTEIVLELATWNPVMIRKTSQRHNLRTDAAQRFEKSLDPENSVRAFMRACELLLKICSNAKFAGPLSDYYPRKPRPISVDVSVDTIQRKIGTVLSEKEMNMHLKALGFGVKMAKKGTLRVGVPSFRATKDINIEDDIVEEVARMHGYEKITPILPMLPICLPRENYERKLKHEARTILSLSLGFIETSHYSFYGSSDIAKCMLPQEVHIELENPFTEDQTHLRVSLLPNMFKVLSANLHTRDEVRIYEIGRTYIKEGSYFPREEKFICGIIARPKATCEIFYDALAYLNAFLKKFRARETRVESPSTKPPYAHPAKCAQLQSGSEIVAAVYEVHPYVVKNFDIAAEVAAFEINFTKLVAGGMDEIVYKPLPRFPGIEIDVSVLVPKTTPLKQICELIRKSEHTFITKVRPIDVFEDPSLGPDKKSLTFRILLQSPYCTLTDDEMKTVQGDIFQSLASAGFEVRGL